MAKLSLLYSLSVCFFIVFHAQAVRLSPRQSQCRIENIDAIEPTRTFRSEAGVTELWDENDNQLECAGVALIRYTIQSRGLLLPHYHNAPKVTYVVQGRGMHGATFPGCSETYQSSQQQQQQYQHGGEQGYESQGGQRSAQGDQHQKVRIIRQGDIVATPIGIPDWFYNEGDTPLILVAFLDTGNHHNQLDDYHRTFYLAGNPQEGEQGRQGKQGGSRSEGRGSQQEENTVNNIFSGFDEKILAEVYGVRQETARRMQGQNDERGFIIRVENGLQTIRPPMKREQSEEEDEQSQQQQQGGSNGIEESFCNIKLRLNIDKPSLSDIYNPEAGRINRINSWNMPILQFFQLNVERGVLYRNALMAPHWHQNAHSVIYVTRGNARVQIVGNYQQPIFDGELRRGQILVVPQNFAVIKRAGDRGFEWVSIKTNDNALTNPLAGRNSALRAMPEDVLVNAFRISREQVRRLKYNRDEIELFAPRFSESQYGESAAA